MCVQRPLAVCHAEKVHQDPLNVTHSRLLQATAEFKQEDVGEIFVAHTQTVYPQPIRNGVNNISGADQLGKGALISRKSKTNYLLTHGVTSEQVHPHRFGTGLARDNLQTIALHF